MPRRLLREPHVFAHDLRTPLGILGGWCSLVRAGDIHPDRTPEQWGTAMKACEEAVTKLNILISQACDEAEALRQLQSPDYSHLLEITTAAIGRSRRIHAQMARHRRAR